MILEFNILRILACYLVISCHYYITLIPLQITQQNWGILFKTPAWAGVWIFFILSGFFSCNYFKKNDISTATIVSFIKHKFIKIALPYYIFVFIIECIQNNFSSVTNNNSFLIQIITFTYNGSLSPTIGIGATWFISTLFQLYILSPICFFFLNKFHNYYKIIFFIIILLGFTYRLCTYIFNISWYIYGYTSVLANIDFFLIGMLLNNYSFKIIKNKIFSYILLIFLILLNIIIYKYENIYQMLFIYQYIMPSFYIICISNIISNISTYKSSTFISFISSISFYIYLIHSNIFYSITKHLNGQITLYKSIKYFIIGISLCIFIGYIIKIIQKK